MPPALPTQSLLVFLLYQKHREEMYQSQGLNHLDINLSHVKNSSLGLSPKTDGAAVPGQFPLKMRPESPACDQFGSTAKKNSERAHEAQ